MRLVVVLVVLLTACAGGAGDTPAEPVAPSTGPAASPGGESITGIFGGDAALEGGCAWVDDGSNRWQVAWPQGYEVQFEPLALHGPDGEVAREGDTLTVTGREDREVMTTCQVGPVWAATEVRAGE